MYPNSIKNLIDSFKLLPGIGEKTAERLAFSLLSFDKETLSNFSNSIIDVRDKIKRCCVCNNISEDDKCSICSNALRKIDTVFVVEKAKDVYLFERLGIYNGLYHVLDGVISPIDGIGPDDIAISNLIDRVKDGTIKEVILALKPSLEGETTMQYITKILSNYDVNVSKLATGVPMGTDIEYIDSLTLEMALAERKSVN
jgi:recombination protein RecR